jgi:hypothetical protein
VTVNRAIRASFAPRSRLVRASFAGPAGRRDQRQRATTSNPGLLSWRRAASSRTPSFFSPKEGGDPKSDTGRPESSATRGEPDPDERNAAERMMGPMHQRPALSHEAVPWRARFLIAVRIVAIASGVALRTQLRFAMRLAKGLATYQKYRSRPRRRWRSWWRRWCRGAASNS